jgi:hypothetical protein
MKRKEILVAYKALANPMNHGCNLVRSRKHLIPKIVVLALAVASSCFAQMDGFGGPSILSRGGAKPGQAGGQPISFNFYAGINGIYNSGSIPLSLNSDGAIQELGVYGGTVNVGLTGSHAWRRSSLGVDYRGDYRKFSRHTYADGTEQAIDLQYTLQATRRITISLSEIAGNSNFANGGFIAPTATLDPNLIGVPTNSIFDNRVSYFQSNASVSYRQSARLSYTFTGDGYTVRRASKDLVGMNGARAGAQVLYQLSRRDQIGVSYNFLHFDYPRAFGASDLHGASLQYARKLGPGLQLSLGAGAYRVETLGSEQVALSPEVAAILGQTSGVRAVYRVNYIPQFQASLNYVHRRSTFMATLAAGATPGNGVYLTSKSQNAGLGYSYSGIRKLSLSFNAGISQYSSVFQTIGIYRNYYGGANAGYILSRHLSATLQSDIRNFIVNNQSRIGTTVTIGLAWSPTEIPIPSW